MNGKGSGALTRERSKRHEIEQQLEEMVADDEYWPQILVVGYSQNAYQYEEQRFLEEEEEVQVEAVTHGFRERARAIRLIACPGYFEDLVSSLELDPEIGVAAKFIVDLEREVYIHAAA
jgi:hypothetical protein